MADTIELIFMFGPADGYRTECRVADLGVKIGDSIRLERGGHVYSSKPWNGIASVVRLWDVGRYGAAPKT